MDTTTENKILTLLTKKFNPWWSGGKTIDTPLFHRTDFHHLQKQLEGDKIVTVIGPRQVGKTTLARQLIRTKLEEGTPPQRIMYAQLDDVELRIYSKHPLIDLVAVYEKNILHENLFRTEKSVYLFFDEIQRETDWAEYLKGIHDANPRVKTFVTGSASFLISQKGKETLPGRSLQYTVFPLKFIDAAILREQELNGGARFFSSIKPEAYTLRNALFETLNTKKPEALFKAAELILAGKIAFEAEIQGEILQYLSKGGYPEIVKTQDLEKCQKLLQGYANDVIVKDLMPWFGIRDFPTAEKLLFLLASCSGEKLNMTEIRKRLDGSNPITLNSYVEHFENLNLLTRLPGFSKSKMGGTKLPKMYFYDAGLQNALLGRLGVILPPEEEGHLAEIVAHDHFRRLLFKLNAAALPRIGYFVTTEKNKEIDFVADLARYETTLPLEVKFRKNIGNEDLQGIAEYQETKKPTFSWVITNQTLELRGKILLMPLWMFLLMA